jgi:glycosyltransferase involved in cell wall biosynthesis
MEGAGVGPGGISRYVAEVLGSWPAGDELCYVTSDAQLAAALPAQVDVVLVAGGGRAATIANVGRATVAQVRARRPDVVISASPSFLPPLPGTPPRVVVLHDLFFRLVPAMISRPQRAYRDAVYRSSLHAARTIVCVSHRTAHDLQCWLPGVADRTVVVANAAADSFHEEPRWAGPSQTQRLVASAHNELKGAGRVISAAARIPGLHVDLLAGSPGRVRDLSAEVTAAGLAGRVQVLGHLPDAELRHLVVTSSGLVMASDIEGFGLPALEALAMDVPVVVSPDPALREATNGAAVTMTTWDAAALVAAIGVLPGVAEDHWRAAGQWARSRRWGDVAAQLREAALR